MTTKLLSSREKYQPESLLAHDLINKLAVIVGQCDLLVDETQEDSQLLNRIILMRDTAKSVAKDLGQLQSDLGRVRTANGENELNT